MCSLFWMWNLFVLCPVLYVLQLWDWSKTGLWLKPAKTSMNWSLLVWSGFLQSLKLWRLVLGSVLSNIDKRPDRIGLSSTICDKCRIKHVLYHLWWTHLTLCLQIFYHDDKLWYARTSCHHLQWSSYHDGHSMLLLLYSLNHTKSRTGDRMTTGRATSDFWTYNGSGIILMRNRTAFSQILTSEIISNPISSIFSNPIPNLNSIWWWQCQSTLYPLSPTRLPYEDQHIHFSSLTSSLSYITTPDETLGLSVHNPIDVDALADADVTTINAWQLDTPIPSQGFLSQHNKE